MEVIRTLVIIVITMEIIVQIWEVRVEIKEKTIRLVVQQGIQITIMITIKIQAHNDSNRTHNKQSLNTNFLTMLSVRCVWKFFSIR